MTIVNKERQIALSCVVCCEEMLFLFFFVEIFQAENSTSLQTCWDESSLECGNLL